MSIGIVKLINYQEYLDAVDRTIKEAQSDLDRHILEMNKYNTDKEFKKKYLGKPLDLKIVDARARKDSNKKYKKYLLEILNQFCFITTARYLMPLKIETLPLRFTNNISTWNNGTIKIQEGKDNG